MSHTTHPTQARAAPYLSANTAYQPLNANPPAQPSYAPHNKPTRHAVANFYSRHRHRQPRDVAHELDARIEKLPAYQRLKRSRQTSRAISTVTSGFMFAAMVATTLVFVNTRSERVDGRSIWPRSPTEWPTYLLLAGALVSLLTAIVTLLLFCCAYERASRSWKLVLALNAVEVGYWIIVTVVYREEKKLADLWGWSCADVAGLLQKEGASVDFDALCTLQTVSWYVSIAETILKVVQLMWCLWLLKKLKKETVHLKMKIIDVVGGQISDGIQNFLI